MAAQLDPDRYSLPNLRRTGFARIVLPLLSFALLALVACGTDRGGNDDEAAAAPFQVDGDTVTWSPPWQTGDTRSVTLGTSLELNPELQAMFDALASAMDSDDGGIGNLTDPQAVNLGTISFNTVNSSGAKAEFDIAFQDLIERSLPDDFFSQSELDESDSEMFSAMLGLIGQIDLGVKFDVDTTGATSGVTNLTELAATVKGFIDSIMSLAVLSGEEAMSPEEREQINTLLTTLPDTQAAQIFADLLLNAATGNMFLMRSGDYQLGQPITVSGTVPSAIGFDTSGSAIYELTELTDTTATIQAEITPGSVDVFALIDQFATELAPIFDADAAEITAGINELDPDERAIVSALVGVLFNPYTVTLTLDASTGWVTSADWSIVLEMPEGFEDLIPEEERDFEGFRVSDFSLTVNLRSTFE